MLHQILLLMEENSEDVISNLGKTDDDLSVKSQLILIY